MRYAPHGVPAPKLGGSSDDVFSIAPHPDGSLLAVCAGSNLHLLAWPTLKKASKQPGSGSMVRYSPDGSQLARTEASSVGLYEPRSGKRVREIGSTKTTAYDIAFSPDGRQIVVVTFKRALVLDVASGEQLAELTGDVAWERVDWSSDGRWIACRAQRATTVFDAATRAPLAVIPNAERGSVVFMRNGALAVVLDATTVGVFAPGNWGEPAHRVTTGARPFALAAGPGVLAVGDGLDVRLFDETLTPIESIKVGWDVYSLAVAPDGRRLFVGCGAKLFAYVADGGAAAPSIAAPLVDVTVRGGRPAPAIDVASAPFLGALGEALPENADIERLPSLEAWPGVDAPPVADFLTLIQNLDEELTDLARDAKVALAEDTYDRAFQRAAEKVPYDPNADWATPASAAPLFVALLASIAEKYRALGLPMPGVIETAWAWALDGHWPAGFAAKPAKGARRLLVL